MVTPRWILSKRSASGASFRGWVFMPAFWLLGTLVLTFLVLLDGTRKDQLTVRIIEEPVFSQPSLFRRLARPWLCRARVSSSAAN
jgi:hypothetical protein